METKEPYLIREAVVEDASMYYFAGRACFELRVFDHYTGISWTTGSVPITSENITRLFEVAGARKIKGSTSWGILVGTNVRARFWLDEVVALGHEKLDVWLELDEEETGSVLGPQPVARPGRKQS